MKRKQMAVVEPQDVDDFPTWANEEDMILIEHCTQQFEYQLQRTESSRVPDAQGSFYDGVGVQESRVVMAFTRE